MTVSLRALSSARQSQHCNRTGPGVEASNADDAIACLDREAIDVAILDYNMPGRNGIKLAEYIRFRFPEMPIAIATANVQDEVIARARATNATFVEKPMTEDGLRGFLSGVVLRRRLGGT